MARLYLLLFPQTLSKQSLKPEREGEPATPAPWMRLTLAAGRGAGAERWVRDKAGTPGPQGGHTLAQGKGITRQPGRARTPTFPALLEGREIPCSNRAHGTK